jgi:hypothetical protein
LANGLIRSKFIIQFKHMTFPILFGLLAIIIIIWRRQNRGKNRD